MRQLPRNFITILVLLSASILAHGQFQEPTAEELHMTSDPKAPGASAIYLYLEEKTDDAVHFHSYYARITYHLPSGVKLDTLPHDPKSEWTSRIGLSMKVSSAADAVTVKRTFVRTSALLDPSLYGNLRYIYQQISAADQQQIVLSRVDNAAGN
jgi:hypothetical protein